MKLADLVYPRLESLEYLCIQSTGSLSEFDCLRSLHLLQGDFLTRTRELSVLTETPELHHIRLGNTNYDVRYRPGVRCSLFERIALIEKDPSVVIHSENPFAHILHAEVRFIG